MRLVLVSILLSPLILIGMLASAVWFGLAVGFTFAEGYFDRLLGIPDLMASKEKASSRASAE